MINLVISEKQKTVNSFETQELLLPSPEKLKKDSNYRDQITEKTP